MASQWNEPWAPSSWAASSWWQNPQTPHTAPTWTMPPLPPTAPQPAASLPAAPWTRAPPSRSNPPEQPADPRPARVPVPAAFKEDGEHYDANLVFKSTLRKTVEPSAWSRAKGLAGMDIRDVTVAHLSRRGLEEYGLRPLANGFTGIILTRNVAETVLLSQIQKRLHEDNSDVDATIEAIYKSKNLKPPDKVKEATNFVTPLVEEIFLAMKPWTQVKNYGKNSEQDNQVALRMQELEEEAAKYKPRLKSAGMEVTPRFSRCSPHLRRRATLSRHRRHHTRYYLQDIRPTALKKILPSSDVVLSAETRRSSTNNCSRIPTTSSSRVDSSPQRA